MQYHLAGHFFGDGLIFQYGNDPENTDNAIKACIFRKTHRGTQAVMDWPP